MWGGDGGEVAEREPRGGGKETEVKGKMCSQDLSGGLGDGVGLSETPSVVGKQAEAVK